MIPYTQKGTFLPAIMRYKYADMKKNMVDNAGKIIDFFLRWFRTSQAIDMVNKGIVPT